MSESNWLPIQLFVNGSHQNKFYLYNMNTIKKLKYIPISIILSTDLNCMQTNNFKSRFPLAF